MPFLHVQNLERLYNMLRPVISGHFVSILRSSMGTWGHLEVILSLCLGTRYHFGPQKNIFVHYKVILSSFRVHFVVISRSFQGHFGVIRGQ